MFFELVIPSYRRMEKLLNCLNSIEDTDKGSNQVDTYVYFNTKEEVDEFGKLDVSKGINLKVLDRYVVPEFWNSHLRQCVSNVDVMVCLNDDVLLKKDTILELEKAFKENFPTFDGIVGLRQSNGPVEQCLDSAFCAIGLKYSMRFPEKQVYCKDYKYLWADKEVGDYAKSINKFYFAEKAELIHLHCAFTGEQPDETHLHTRSNKMLDKTTYFKRRQLGCLWGRDYKLINNERK